MPEKIIDVSGKKSLRVSLSFFVLVFILSAGVFGYNFKLQGDISALETEKSNIQKSVNTLKANKQIAIASLLFENKATIEKMKKRNNYTAFLNHFYTLEQTYGAKFEGFSFSNGELSTQVSFLKQNSDATTKQKLAYESFVSFVEEYNKKTTSDFELAFIESITGSDTLKVPLKFILK